MAEKDKKIATPNATEPLRGVKPEPENTAGENTMIERRNTEPAAPPVRERRKYKVSETPPPPPPPPKLNDYATIIGQPEIDEIRYIARLLRGKTVKMVNSTAVGGGVAEILNRLIPLMQQLEVQTKWEVITGGNDFFEVTKGFHNALHGGEYNLTQEAKDIFISYNEQNRQRMNFDEDVVVIHDPQPAGLIKSRGEDQKWIWRCHI